MYFREKPAWSSPPAQCFCYWSQPVWRTSWNPISPTGLRLFLQLELHRHILISFFTDQSEWLYSHQSEKCPLNQSNWWFEVLICEDRPIGDQGQDFSLSKSASSLWLWELTFPFHWRLHFPVWSWNTEDASLGQSRWVQSRLAGSRPGRSGAELSSYRGAWL